MAGNWNPSAPNVAGNELRGVYAYLDKATKSPFKGMKLRSNLAETIADIELGIGPTINTSSPLFKILAIYNANSIVLGAGASEFHAAPDAHGTGTGIGNWRTQAGSATTIYTSIDDTVKYPPVGSDYIRTTGAISNAFFHMNTGAFPLTARVGRLLIRGVVGTGGTYRDIYFRLWHVPSGTLFTPPGDRVRAHYYGLLHSVDLGDINPVTLLPWSPVDIRGFEAANNVWQVRITGAGSVANPLILHNLELLIQHATEKRVAVGTWQRPPGAAVGVGVAGVAGQVKHIVLDQLVHPDGAGNWVADWAKPSSGDFVFVWHNALDRLVGGAEPRAQDIHWHFVGGNDRDGLVGSPVPGQAAGDVVFGSASSQVQGEVFSAGPFDQPLAGTIALIRSDGVTSDDSQPYLVKYSDNALYLAQPSDTIDVIQKFTAPATDSYGGLRFQVKPPTDGTLQVTVHVWLTDAQVGGSFEVDAATLAAQASLTNMPGFKDVRGSLSSAAALTSGTLYYLRFRKLTGTPGLTWGLTILDAETLTSHEEATFQGLTGHYATINRTTTTETTFNSDDLAVQLIAAPDDPLNVVATKLSQPIALDYDPACALAGPQCGPTALDYVRITWNSPGTYTGAGFLQWDIERREPDGVTWTAVGVSAEEGLSSFEDYEAIRNRPNLRYRVRARTADAGFSGWVETADLEMVTEEAEILFTSNARPDLNVGYAYDPDVRYDFLDHDADELMRLSSVPYQAGFIDATNRGVTGTYELLANFVDQPVDTLGNPIGGETIFEPIRRMVRSDYNAELLLPYVCVLDYEGNRRFAYVRLDNGRRSEPRHRYTLEALVVPLTDTPTIVRREALASSALLLDGLGDLISTPHVSTLGITGDIEFRWEVEFGTTGFPTIQTVASKWDAGSQGSWILQHESANNGRPRLIWTPNGTVASQIIGLANATPPWDLANRMAFKATLDVNDGAGNWGLNFYWALRHGGPYTQLGTTVTAAGITSLFNTTSAPLRIGAHSGTSEPFAGLVYEFDLYNGLAGTDRRVDLNLRGYTTFGTPQITDTAGRVYSYTGNAQIVEVAGVA